MDNALCTNRGGGGNLPRGCIATEALKIQECEDNFGCINATYPSIHPSMYPNQTHRDCHTLFSMFSPSLCSWPPGPAACGHSSWVSSLTTGGCSPGRSLQR